MFFSEAHDIPKRASSEKLVFPIQPKDILNCEHHFCRLINGSFSEKFSRRHSYPQVTNGIVTVCVSYSPTWSFLKHLGPWENGKLLCRMLAPSQFAVTLLHMGCSQIKLAVHAPK